MLRNREGGLYYCRKGFETHLNQGGRYRSW